MKTLLRLSFLLLLLCGMMAAQAINVPTCNGFDANGVPIDNATNSTNAQTYSVSETGQTAHFPPGRSPDSRSSMVARATSIPSS
jgi:hypothetical protein